MNLRKSLLGLIILCVSCWGAAQTWTPIGPEGGDARSLAYDPHDPQRLYLGTSSGQLYFSADGGDHWIRLATLGSGTDYVLDHIVVDAGHRNTLLVASWTIDREGGDLFRSHDGGLTWESIPDLHGKSIRAFAQAPSDPSVLVAGTLDGVFRSQDGGSAWEQISPPHHAEIRNVESIAIDPANPGTVYAGTWHLPWKTDDGGLTWYNIKRGVIDDSDVFSIIVDPHEPAVVYASACSGIYRSENAGDLFHKVQGIPYSARRTRVLRQDPNAPGIVYAGTTEGLWKTSDSGHTWKRITAANVIVNDVFVDPADSGHVVIATDRSGVLASHDGGDSFAPANSGFVHRQVAALLAGSGDPNEIYAGVINDKEYGGVFVSRDAGAQWTQMSAGLGGRDVFVLRETADGHVLAGTDRGIMQWFDREAPDRTPVGKSTGQETPDATWQPFGLTLKTESTKVVERRRTKSGHSRGRVAVVRTRTVASHLDFRINDLEVSGPRWYAATSRGLYYSTNQGRLWDIVSSLRDDNVISISATPDVTAVATHTAVLISLDRGKTWSDISPPSMVTAIAQVLFAPDGTLWVAAREGAFRTSDGGDRWEYIRTLPVNNLAGISWDPELKQLLVTSNVSTDLYSSADGNRWQKQEAGWLLRSVRGQNGRLLATTAFDGIVVQPEERPVVQHEEHAALH